MTGKMTTDNYTLFTCAICGCKRRYPQTIKEPFRLLYPAHDKLFAAGTQFCRLHNDSVLQASHPYWTLFDAPITNELLLSWIDELEAWIAKGQPVEVLPSEWQWHVDTVNTVNELRRDLANVKGSYDLLVFRNTVLPLVLQSRGSSIYDQRRVAIQSA